MLKNLAILPFLLISGCEAVDKAAYIANLPVRIVSGTATDGLQNTLNQIKSPKLYVDGADDLPVYPGFRHIGKKDDLAETGENQEEGLDENQEPEKEGNNSITSLYSRNANSTYRFEQLSVNDVEYFYYTTLPELGWREGDNFEYTRDNQLLKLSVYKRHGIVYIKFIIQPMV
jgi:hypothetical protein